MVSVGISSLGRTKLIFIDPVVKINGSYYWNMLLWQHLLPANRSISGLFQRTNALAHRARKTVALQLLAGLGCGENDRLMNGAALISASLTEQWPMATTSA